MVVSFVGGDLYTNWQPFRCEVYWASCYWQTQSVENCEVAAVKEFVVDPVVKVRGVGERWEKQDTVISQYFL